MINCRKVRFKTYSDEYGSLVPIEEDQDTGFPSQRIYYIYGVGEGVRRGFHSHRDLEQILLCVRGQVTIHLAAPESEEEVLLNDPSEGLYIGPMIWREMYDFSPDAVLLVLASRHYDESDYIRNFEAYMEEAREYFKEKR